MSIRNKIQKAYLSSGCFKKQIPTKGIALGEKEYNQLLDELKSIQRYNDPNDPSNAVRVTSMTIELPEGLRRIYYVNDFSGIGFIMGAKESNDK